MHDKKFVAIQLISIAMFSGCSILSLKLIAKLLISRLIAQKTKNIGKNVFSYGYLSSLYKDIPVIITNDEK